MHTATTNHSPTQTTPSDERQRRHDSEAPAGVACEPDTLEARAREIVRAHLDDPSFSVQKLAGTLHLTYATLNRRLGAETDTKPNELIRQVRLQEAAALLRDGAGSISEVAYDVGFNKPSYFSRRFREHFGVLPSRYVPPD